MSEIEKMYENAGVKKINTHQSEIDNGDPRFTGISHSDSYIKYPPFTAEKQLKLIKWLIQEVDNLQLWYFGGNEEAFDFDLGKINVKGATFEETLASLINDLWQDLTEEEKQQIKEILE